MSFTLALMLAAAPAPDSVTPSAPMESVPPLTIPLSEPVPAAFSQVVIEREIIIRVPAQRSSLNNFAASPRPEQAPEMPIVWKEKNAPKCVDMHNVMGMQAVQRDSIDLITRQKQRLRAQLNRGCRALDFYSGFYMQMNKDGRLCEDRDSIHARSGAKCEIDKFHTMVPVRRKK